MCCDSPSPPSPPDLTGAANAQAAASAAITNTQNYANRPNQNTPWGASTWDTAAVTDPATGQQVTEWTQNQTLNPNLQGALDSQIDMIQGRSDLALGAMGDVNTALGQPMDYSQFTDRQGLGPQQGLDTAAPTQTTTSTNPNMFSEDRLRIEQAMMDRMNPEQDRENRMLDTKLANQGLTPGSEAYNRAKQQLGDQHSRDDYNAIATGGQEQSRMQASLLAQNQQAFGQDVASQQAGNQALQSQFGQDLTGANFNNTNRAQEIAETQGGRTNSLNEMNALVSGQQVAPPQMPGFVPAQASQTPNLLGAMSGNYNNQLDVYNAGQAGSQGMMSGLFGLGGAVLGGPMGGMIGSGVGRLFG